MLYWYQDQNTANRCLKTIFKLKLFSILINNTFVYTIFLNHEIWYIFIYILHKHMNVSWFIFPFQFREQATLTGVAQAVVDKAVRRHHDWYMSNSVNPTCAPNREDITLVLRNFNYPLPNAITSPTTPSVSFNSAAVTSASSTIASVTNTATANTLNSTSRTTDTTSSSSCYGKDEADDGLGPDKKIEGYVDFTDFYKNYYKAKENGTLPEGLEEFWSVDRSDVALYLTPSVYTLRVLLQNDWENKKVPKSSLVMMSLT